MIRILLFDNLFFIVNIFVFLALFASSWLHFDSWKANNKGVSYLSRAIGFMILAVTFLITSVQTDNQLFIYINYIFKIYGSFMLFLSLISEKKLANSMKALIVLPALSFIPNLELVNKYLPIVPPIFFIIFLIGLYLKIRYRLEKQLSGLLNSFIFLTLVEVLNTLYYWSDSKIVFINDILSKGGALSIIILCLKLIGAIILTKWIWGYVRFRTGIQIFFTTLGLILIIFIFTTFSFTYLLLRNIENNILESLRTDAKVALYSIERLQFEAIANSKSIATNSDLPELIETEDRNRLQSLINSQIESQNLSFIVVTDSNGKIISSTIDEESRSISYSDDPTFKNAMTGKPLSTLYKNEGALAPTIEVRSSSPVIDSKDKTVVGTVISGFLIDNPMLDSIKELTNMEITIYGNSIRSASTINLDGEKTRYVGIAVDDNSIIETVLEKGDEWSGQRYIVNKPYYSVYLPLKNFNTDTIGMISVAKPQSTLAELSNNAIQSTFIVCIALFVLSIIPSFFISKYIEENVTA